ncbi:MAG TPA: hypothetical protein VFW19_14465 [Allosphingosinicella sp.]|nr:hypothetical protein [Allosphingosinicella sp.]
MQLLTIDDFSGKTGTPYDVLVNGGAFPLTLAEVQPLPDSGREGGCFRLEFRGPMDPVLPQAVYPFRSDGVTVEIFVVPIARDQGGVRYEAIFF